MAGMVLYLMSGEKLLPMATNESLDELKEQAGIGAPIHWIPTERSAATTKLVAIGLPYGGFPMNRRLFLWAVFEEEIDRMLREQLDQTAWLRDLLAQVVENERYSRKWRVTVDAAIALAVVLGVVIGLSAYLLLSPLF